MNDLRAVFGPDRHNSRKCCTNSGRHRDAAYAFSAGPRGAGRTGGSTFSCGRKKTAARANTQFTRDDFYRDENCDVYLCPGGKESRLRRLAREPPAACFGSIRRIRRLRALSAGTNKAQESDKHGARKVSVSYFAAESAMNLKRAHEPVYREALKSRQVWCEGFRFFPRRSASTT